MIIGDDGGAQISFNAETPGVHTIINLLHNFIGLQLTTHFPTEYTLRNKTIQH